MSVLLFRFWQSQLWLHMSQTLPNPTKLNPTKRSSFQTYETTLLPIIHGRSEGVRNGQHAMPAACRIATGDCQMHGGTPLLLLQSANVPNEINLKRLEQNLWVHRDAATNVISTAKEMKLKLRKGGRQARQTDSEPASQGRDNRKGGITNFKSRSDIGVRFQRKCPTVYRWYPTLCKVYQPINWPITSLLPLSFQLCTCCVQSRTEMCI